MEPINSSSKIASISDVESLSQINGLPITEIERRARALLDKTEDPTCWRCRSSSGFLGPGTTHKNLASHLHVILETATKERKIQGKSSFNGTPVTIQYWAQDLTLVCISPFTCKISMTSFFQDTTNFDRGHVRLCRSSTISLLQFNHPGRRKF
eukprot:TRINITY_DN218_c0_g1_i12.p1 TRINITY_DN218_c0_g1~~TRINITY_DN218_c0_g1_i12.p1  ORF type:complete len:153 (-),score=7.42 TRINITY_DN218_c0_g1_i12:509-967(-)